MFLIDKYRPKKLSDFLFNNEILNKLMFISSNEDIPHMILTGPNCSGKETLMDYLLEILFDPDVKKVSRVKYQITCPSGKKEVFVNQSNYHISFEPTNTNHDKYILQGIISQYATNQSFKIFKTNRDFKIFVIRNAENLASNCQYILRRNMELYAPNLRIFILCNDLSKLIDPLRSRCQIICLSTPTIDNIKSVLNNIIKKESLEMPKNKLQSILNDCNNNLSKAIWMLECHILETNPKLNLEKAYDLLIKIIFDDNKCICTTFSDSLRTNAYNVLITNIKGSELILTLMTKIIDKVDDEELICSIIQCASVSEYNLVHGRRDIMHVDFFIISVMKLLKKYKPKIKPVKQIIKVKKTSINNKKSGSKTSNKKKLNK